MRIKIKISSVFDYAIYMMIFLIGFQFINQTQLFVFLLGIVILLYCAYKKRVLLLPVEFWILTSAFTFYFFISMSGSENVNSYHYAAYWLGPIIGYMTGYCFLNFNINTKFEKVKKVLFSICLGTTLFALACICYKFINPGLYSGLASKANIYITMQNRYALNFWNNTLIQPTNLNSICIFTILLSFYVVNYITSKKIRILYWISLGVAILVIFTTATRTNIILFPIGFAISAFFARKDIRFKLTFRKVIMIIVLLTILLISSNNMMNLLQNSLLSTRTESLDNNRIESIVRVLEDLDKYPMGNMPYSHAHNLWVDVARVAGIIPMVLLIVYTIFVTNTLYRLIKNRYLKCEIKTLFLGMTLGMLISFMIEPVIEGRPFIFMFFCIVNGMCNSMTKISMHQRSRQYTL